VVWNRALCSSQGLFIMYSSSRARLSSIKSTSQTQRNLAKRRQANHLQHVRHRFRPPTAKPHHTQSLHPVSNTHLSTHQLPPSSSLECIAFCLARNASANPPANPPPPPPPDAAPPLGVAAPLPPSGVLLFEYPLSLGAFPPGGGVGLRPTGRLPGGAGGVGLAPAAEGALFVILEAAGAGGGGAREAAAGGGGGGGGAACLTSSR